MRSLYENGNTPLAEMVLDHEDVMRLSIGEGEQYAFGTRENPDDFG
jgi:hypothetical protein